MCPKNGGQYTFHVLDGLFSYVKFVMNDIKTNKIKSFDLVAVKEF